MTILLKNAIKYIRTKKKVKGENCRHFNFLNLTFLMEFSLTISISFIAPML